MTRAPAICLVLASLAAVPHVVAADVGIQDVFDAVDSVETKIQTPCTGCLHTVVVVSGIEIRPSGSVHITGTFDFGSNTDMATRCEHMAMIAMSKPGKYQFAIGSDPIGPGHGDCKLILITP